VNATDPERRDGFSTLRDVDSGSTSSGSGRASRSNSGARLADPVDPRSESVIVESTPANGTNGNGNGHGSNGNGAKQRDGLTIAAEHDVADAVAIAEAVLAAEARRVAEAPPVVETTRVAGAPAIVGEPAFPDEPSPEPATGKPAGRGRGFGRFRSKAMPVSAPDRDEADAPHVSLPFVDPGLMAPPAEPLPAPVPVARTAEPVVTRVVEVPTQPVPTMPAPVIIPSIPVIPVTPDGTGELVARVAHEKQSACCVPQAAPIATS